MFAAFIGHLDFLKILFNVSYFTVYIISISHWLLLQSWFGQISLLTLL